MHYRKILVAIAVLPLLAGCGVIPTLDEMILRPNPTITTTPADAGYEYEELSVPVAADRSVTVWHVKAPAPPAGIVVVVPGSTGNKSMYVAALPVFVGAGYDVLLMDYEGYGNSPGEPTLQHAADDVMAVADYAFAQFDTVVLYGVSLGSPLAARAAATHRPAALILEASLILASEAGLWLEDNNLAIPIAMNVGDWFAATVMPEEYDIIESMAAVDAPTLIMHSVDDEVTPYPGGEQVFDAAAGSRTFWQMRHKHGKMFFEEPEVYTAAVQEWLRQNVVAGQAP